jgi:hypothetical protein
MEKSLNPGSDLSGNQHIDVSSLGNEFLGLNHNTFSASMSVADDLARLIADGLRPPSRRTPIIVGVPSSDMAAFFKFPN